MKGRIKMNKLLYVVANENVVRILDEVNLIKHFEECRVENEKYHLSSNSEEIKAIPSIINKELPSGVLNLDDTLKLWDLDLKADYPFFWIIDTDTMEADFRNAENNTNTKVKLSLSKEELLNIKYQDKHQSNAEFICNATDKNMIKVIDLLWGNE